MEVSRERMSAVDAAWLRMDRPTNAMVITALLTFDDAPGFTAIEELVRTRMLPWRRFRQRVVEPPVVPPRWVDDPEFDLRLHLHRAALPAPGGDRELEELIAELASTALDHDRPLWQIHVIERGRGAAVLVRMHHCVGDGVALIRMLLGVSDQERAMSTQAVGLTPPRPHGWIAIAREAARQTAALTRMLTLWPDPPSALRGELGARKLLVSSRPIPLAAVKAIAASHHAHVNDVLVAAIAGALRRHLLRHGGVPQRALRAMVPVYLGGQLRAGDLGNHFGLVFLDLPVGSPDAAERLRVAQARMDQLKRSPDAIVALEVLGALGLASPAIEDLAIDLFTSKASILFTNVAGPPDIVHLAGKPVTSMVVWAPVSGHLGLGISALSYAGMLRVGIKADSRCVPDPAALLVDLDAELDALRM
jgi:diacylglycerol O-acyltransferase / wax synthase